MSELQITTQQAMPHTAGRPVVDAPVVGAGASVPEIKPSVITAPDPVEVQQKTHANGSSVFVLEDKEMDFDEILKAPLPKAPLEVTFRAHWLAIEGVQPLIPENPLPDGMDAMGTILNSTLFSDFCIVNKLVY